MGNRLVLEGLTGSSFSQDNPGGEGAVAITVPGEVCRKSWGAAWLGFGREVYAPFRALATAFIHTRVVKQLTLLGKQVESGAGEISTPALQRT